MKKNFSSLLKSIIRFFRQQFRNPRKRIISEVAAIVVIVGIVIFMVFSGRNLPTADLKDGVSYIKSLEKTDTAPTESKIKEIKKAERKAALESGEVDVWQQFNDSAILGDSRAVGFEFYEFVDGNRVFAEAGATLRGIPDHINELKTLNPSTVFLCYGINDVSIGLWKNVDEYIAEFDDTMDKLHEALPDTLILMNSIIPATDPAFKKSQKWRDIPDWNAAIKKHCEDKNIPYIDITETVEEHSNLYDVDGIHMQRAFYDFWGIDMITEVNEYE